MTMIVRRRTLEFVVLVWSAVLASTCQSFSVRKTVSLSAGPPVQELEKTGPTVVPTSIASNIEDANNQTEPRLVVTETTQKSDSESASSTALSSLASLFPDNKQILQFQEPQTNVTVVLIGSMHYNPASISLVERTVEDLGATNQLGSVIIESCDIRWNKTQEIMEKKKAKQERKFSSENKAEQFIDSNPNDKDFLGNEMRAAWEVATKYHRPTILGDQRINITVDALKASFKETISDLFLSGPSGWERSRDEIAANWKKSVPISAGQPNAAAAATTLTDNSVEPKYLNAFAFFDPRLLISLPVSLVKYPLSFLVKDPIPVGSVFAIIAYLNFYADGTTSLFDSFSLEEMVSAATTSKEYAWTDYVVSLGIAVLETVIFARLLLKPLLADRNEILARSVLDQCLLYTADNDRNNESLEAKGVAVLGNFFRNLWSPSPPVTTSKEEPVYVPGSDPESLLLAEGRASAATGNGENIRNNEGKVVVAVLGMAHCNGVMKLLREQKV